MSVSFCPQHVFTVQHVDTFIASAFDYAQTFLGLTLKRSKVLLTRDYCREFRLGNASEEELTSQAEFVVQKISSHAKKKENVHISRLLCITDGLLLERDPLSYRAVCATHYTKYV
ncbi:hypothetical protein FGIG_11456 [Fasciola gigantica]|uniref:DnaJ homologue subfamily C GRV2/DNAJC13 N-terminal domain-containing protein n=1 Tax=Fasciola gigantica TaxID=46835 RepID=A0A504YIT6_FASGI|nr:hypothetical protein FGIG_11456 [Fasciola gigantica]